MDQDVGQDRDECLWTEVETAAYLKVTARWVYDRARAGLLPHRKLPGRIRKGLRFVPAEIRAYALGLAQPASAPMRKSA